MAQDPLSHVASWLTPTPDVVETVDPIVAMKAELDRLQAEIKRIPDAVIDDADAQALIDQTCDLETKILDETVAISPLGLIAQIELLRDCGSDYGSDGFNLLIAGARNIEAATSRLARYVNENAAVSTSLSNDGRPIDSAPVKAGEEFGPCLLLAPSASFDPPLTPWIMGGWDGENWYDLDGPIVHPTHWAPLPDTP
jgi:hypothetical protein